MNGEQTSVQPAKTTRIQSVDTMRGITMILVIGLADALKHLPEMWDNRIFRWIAAEMPHAEWHGFTIGDLFFPILIFIAGIVFPISTANRLKKGGTRREIFLHVAQRAVMLMFIGMVYNGLLRDFRTVRYCSVLGKIGAAWLIASLIFLLTRRNRTRLLWAGGMLIAYWLMMRFIPAPDFPGAPLYSPEGSIACYIDRLLIPQNHLYRPLYDAEGILSCITAAAECLLGMLTGEFILSTKAGLTPTRKAVYMGVAGVVMHIVGLVWGRVFPINKRLFTSTFVCVSAGVALMFFALLYYIIDVRGWNKWDLLFRMVGFNGFAMYVGATVADFRSIGHFLFGSVISLFPPYWYNFLDDFQIVVLACLISYWLYKRKICIKI